MRCPTPCEIQRWRLTLFPFSRTFIEKIFGKENTSRPASIVSRASESAATPTSPPKLRELYRRAKLLFDLSACPSA